jgi:hypothetical protein
MFQLPLQASGPGYERAVQSSLSLLTFFAGQRSWTIVSSRKGQPRRSKTKKTDVKIRKAQHRRNSPQTLARKK